MDCSPQVIAYSLSSTSIPDILWQTSFDQRPTTQWSAAWTRYSPCLESRKSWNLIMPPPPGTGRISGNLQTTLDSTIASFNLFGHRPTPKLNASWKRSARPWKLQSPAAVTGNKTFSSSCEITVQHRTPPLVNHLLTFFLDALSLSNYQQQPPRWRINNYGNAIETVNKNARRLRTNVCTPRRQHSELATAYLCVNHATTSWHHSTTPNHTK